MPAKYTHEQYLQWLLDNNTNLVPLVPYPGSQQVFPHQCSQGHIVNTSFKTLRITKGCTKCRGTGPVTLDDYLARLLVKGSSLIPVEPFTKMSAKIIHRCPEGHDYLVAPATLLSGNTSGLCPFCTGHRTDTESLKRRLRESGTNLILQEPFKGTIVVNHKFLCPEGHITFMTPDHIISEGKGCKYCSGKVLKTTAQYRQELLDNNRRDVEPVEEYITSKTPILHKCNEGHQWKNSPTNILNKNNGCPVCVGLYSPTTEEWVAFLQEKEVIFLDKEYTNAHTKNDYKYPCGCILTQTPQDIKDHDRACPTCKQPSVLRDFYFKELTAIKNITPLEDYVDIDTKIRHQYNCCGRKVRMRPMVALKMRTCRGCGADCNKISKK